MTANDVVESYITDVAVRLPRSQRSDVAFELRALLTEELQAKAVAAGHDADAAMAIELLRAFGRPEAVAARYLPTLTIIDPSDGHRFLRLAVVGLALIWSAGLLMHVWLPLQAGQDVPHALGQWWGRTVIPSLWWPGVLAVGFGIAAWTRRRWPQASKWKPRGGDEIQGGRAVVALGVVGILCGMFVLMDPSRVLDVFLQGRAAPAAYEALMYTDAFRQRQAPWLFGLLLLNVPILASVIVLGRWTKGLRRMDAGLSLSTCAVMAWTVLDGPILRAEFSDRTARFSMCVILACVLVHRGVRKFRTVRPAPVLHCTQG